MADRSAEQQVAYDAADQVQLASRVRERVGDAPTERGQRWWQVDAVVHVSQGTG